MTVTAESEDIKYSERQRQLTRLKWPDMQKKLSTEKNEFEMNESSSPIIIFNYFIDDLDFIDQSLEPFSLLLPLTHRNVNRIRNLLRPEGTTQKKKSPT